MNAPFDLDTNRIRSTPSGAGKRQRRVSVLSLCICLTRVIDNYCCLYQPSTTCTLNYKNQNRLSLCARESSMLWNSVAAAGGGRNQLSSRGLSYFSELRLRWVCLWWYWCPLFAQLPSTAIPTPIPHLSTASCTYPTSNDACAEEMASPAPHMKAIAAAVQQQK